MSKHKRHFHRCFYYDTNHYTILATMKTNIIYSLIFILLPLAVCGQNKSTGISPSELETSLPIIVISTDNPLNAQKKVDAKMKIIDSRKGMNTISSKSINYEGHIGIKLRGNSSLSFNQKKYTIETCDGSGKSLNVSLLGMPEEHDWVLLAPYMDVSMIRDPLAFQLWEEMGYWAPRRKMVEVIFNDDYKGIYILTEKIKQDKNRVDIAKIKPEDNSGRELTGGYLLRIDTYDGDDATFESKVAGIGNGMFNQKVVWTCLTPKKGKLTEEQFNYISNYIDSMEQCILSDDFTDGKKDYSKYINVSSFVDYIIHTELSLNADAYKRSAYFIKKKQNEDGTGGKISAGPVWDYNLAYGNCNFCGANDIYGWAYEGCNTSPTPFFWKRLMEDPEFVKSVSKRYKELRSNILSEIHLDSIIDGYAKQLAEAQKRHFEKYPELLHSQSGKNENNIMMGGFPMMPGFGDMPMPDFSNMTQMPGFGNIPMPDFGNMPQMPGFGNIPMPDFSNMPQMPGFGNMPMPDFSNMPQMPGFGDMQNFTMDASMFAAYFVSSYDEEIKMLKDWIHERLAVMDERFLTAQ